MNVPENLHAYASSTQVCRESIAGEDGCSHSGRSLENTETLTALSILETRSLGIKPHGGEDTTPKTTASPLPAHKQGPLGSAFQTNRRESFHQRDLEEKMVHKVTMDTVKIITSSVSGMTNVSEPHPPAHWAGTLQPMARICTWLRLGGTVHAQTSVLLLPGMPEGLGLPMT